VLVASSNFLVPNTTFVVELVAFLIVLFVLGRYVLPRLNQMMTDRQQAIRQALADAEEARERKAEAETERQRVIREAQQQARSIMEEANKQAEQMRAERRQQAEQEYERIVGSAYADIEAQTRRAQEDLRRQAAELAVTVAERILGEGIDRTAQESLINRTISEVAAGGGA
jgi:F-type H+-transporting ATPase subunit b